MYRIDQPTRRRRPLRRLLVVGLCCVAVVSVIGIRQMLESDTVIRDANPTTTHVSVATPPRQTVTKSAFQLDLPKDWKESSSTTPLKYSWQGTLKEDDARQLDVYVDTLPANLAVNRLLPVQSTEDRMLASGSVSDNCINFTDKTTANPQTGAAPAKWAGVNFLCDTANSLRNVVGTGSTDGVNTVSVKSPNGSVHHYFLVYTDHSAQADYDTFTDAVNSFRAR
jgi:hypothetical protein